MVTSSLQLMLAHNYVMSGCRSAVGKCGGVEFLHVHVQSSIY